MQVLAIDTHVAIFHALHRVMAAEQALKSACIRHRVLATPRPLTSSCGLAIAFPGGELASLERVLADGPRVEELWRSDGRRYERVVTTCRARPVEAVP